MSQITPAIISQNFEDIKAKIAQIEGRVPWVHLDIMDGQFVPPITWQAPDDLVNIGGKIKIEAHLMIEKPETELVAWIEQVDRVLIHFEATDQLAAIIEAQAVTNCQLGLAVELDTALDHIANVLPELTFIQLMSIRKIGYHGHNFDLAVLDKIKTLRQIWPDGTIQIDGGVNLDTGRLALEAGADILVAGSSIWQADDPLAVIYNFQQL